MDSDKSGIIIKILASIILLLKTVFLLAVSPYTTMRRLVRGKDIFQLAIIYTSIVVYFFLSKQVRFDEVDRYVLMVFTALVWFCIFFCFQSLFCFLFYRYFHRSITLSSIITAFSFALIPTLVWFYGTMFLYFPFPPGQIVTTKTHIFNAIFFTFSFLCLCWKIILYYLAIRFTSKARFSAIVFWLILMVTMSVPFSYFMYTQKIFRIPFI